LSAGTECRTKDAGTDSARAEPSLITPKFVVVVLATFLYFLTVGAQIPTVPRYASDELGGGGLQVGIAVGAFAVSAAALRPWVGRLGDVRGRRILVMGGAAVAGVSLLFYPLATSIPALVAARLATGAGEAAVFTGAASAAQDLAPDHRRGEAASYFSVALYAGIGVGPFAGESLLKATNFPTVFLTAAAVSLLASCVAWKIPVGKKSRASTAQPVGLVHPAAIWPGLILFLGLVPVVAFGAFLPLYGEQIGMDDVGPVLALYAAVVLVVRIFGGKLPDALGWRRGSGMALVGVAVGAGVIGAWQSSVAVWMGAVGLAVGMSLLFPALFLAVINSAPERERTHAIGSFSLFFDLAQGLGAALIGAVVSLSGEQGGFLVAAACAFAGLFVQRLAASRIRV
jgi:MFS family permease